ncbi:MAG: protein kinase [Gemmatimonadaceae bacterium]|nr:protein kinase [Gemmatimonadaceae bacterium]
MNLRDQLQQTLGNAYTLERELGGGGMSRVFLAEDRTLGRKVVAKVLPPELTAGVNVERFNREILLAAKLQHPHIVPVHSAGEMDGLLWFTMPFVEGESLRARLGRGAIGITESVSLLRDVAKALAYAHERGMREYFFAAALRRLGELDESKGNRARALEYYGRFVDLWKDADPEFQGLVADIRKHMAQLAGEPPRP